MMEAFYAINLVETWNHLVLMKPKLCDRKIRLGDKGDGNAIPMMYRIKVCAKFDLRSVKFN